MRKFDVIKTITDEKKFSELIFDLVSECKTSEKLTELLSEEIPTHQQGKHRLFSYSNLPFIITRHVGACN